MMQTKQNSGACICACRHIEQPIGPMCPWVGGVSTEENCSVKAYFKEDIFAVLQTLLSSKLLFV